MRRLTFKYLFHIGLFPLALASCNDDAALVTQDAGDPNTQSDADPGTSPAQGNVGPAGGKVDRLFFAFHGDTRPAQCGDSANYPKQVIQQIFSREAAAGVQFTMDLGDHMFVCNGSLPEAQKQMGFYMDASKMSPTQTFLTMGNHECGLTSYCEFNSADANMQAFMAALAPVSSLPYYTFDVTLRSGKATFVVIADNAWDSTQQAWLETTLAAADKNAKYTIVTRHHPIDNTDTPNPAIWTIVKAHKYSLMLTGHTHAYKHDTYSDQSGRTLRMGNGGAPLEQGTTFNGYGIVQQGMDDKLYVTVYNAANGMPMDSFSLAPQ